MNQIEHIMAGIKPDTGYWDDDTGKDVWSYSEELVRAAIEQALAVQPKQDPVALSEQYARSHAKFLFKAPQPQPYDQQALELCDVCGWKTLIPGDGCLNCERKPQPQLKQEPVHQFRSPHCSDWYDGVPDHQDGHGPYDVRTLYTAPQPHLKAMQQALDCLEDIFGKNKVDVVAINALREVLGIAE